MSKQALVEVRQALTQMESAFRFALPAHIPSAKFVRTAQTAIQLNPTILDCDRRSIYASCMKAAQDGLVLDGREAALVKFKDQCQYMPMVAGILKKARNSGEISTISAHVVYEQDHFTYVLGDDERIEHKPHLGGNRGKPILVYSIAKLRDGGIMREIMTVEDVNKIRAMSRSGQNGPWASWWEEMAKKTVIRRLSKRLPSSSDREDDEFQRTVTRDDELYQVDDQAGTTVGDDKVEVQPPARRRTRASAAIDKAAENAKDVTPKAKQQDEDVPPPASADDYGHDTTPGTQEDLI